MSNDRPYQNSRSTKAVRATRSPRFQLNTYRHTATPSGSGGRLSDLTALLDGVGARSFPHRSARGDGTTRPTRPIVAIRAGNPTSKSDIISPWKALPTLKAWCGSKLGIFIDDSCFTKNRSICADAFSFGLLGHRCTSTAGRLDPQAGATRASHRRRSNNLNPNCWLAACEARNASFFFETESGGSLHPRKSRRDGTLSVQERVVRGRTNSR